MNGIDLFTFPFVGRYIKYRSAVMADGADVEVSSGGAHFAVTSLWNGDPIDHQAVRFRVSGCPGNAVQLDVSGPLFNDPGPPPGPPGKACPELWEYEVAEVFFLGENERYLEVELCPHGQHLVLLLDGVRNMFKDQLKLEFSAVKDEVNKTWSGTAHVPIEYFPPGVNKINAYAIHGSGHARQYEALYPASKDFSMPDFHRLQFFKHFNFTALFPEGWSQPKSQLWESRLK